MKKLINEIARMQRIAGLITESEYQEAANVMDVAKSLHLEALKKELNSSNLDNWYISTTSSAYGIEITSTSEDQSQKFSTKHDNEGNVTDAHLYKIQPTSSNQKSLSITPAQKKEFLDRIKNTDSVDLEMDAANILARVLTNDEAEFIEDVEDFGFDSDAVEDLAQKLVGIITENQINEVSDGEFEKKGKTYDSVSPRYFEPGDIFLRGPKYIKVGDDVKLIGFEDEWEIKAIDYPKGNKNYSDEAIISFTNGKKLTLSQLNLYNIRDKNN